MVSNNLSIFGMSSLNTAVAGGAALLGLTSIVAYIYLRNKNTAPVVVKEETAPPPQICTQHPEQAAIDKKLAEKNGIRIGRFTPGWNRFNNPTMQKDLMVNCSPDTLIHTPEKTFKVQSIFLDTYPNTRSATNGYRLDEDKNTLQARQNGQIKTFVLSSQY